MNASRCRQRFSNRKCLPTFHNTHAQKYTQAACCLHKILSLIVTFSLYSHQRYSMKCVCERQRYSLPVLESLLKSKASTINVYDLWKKEEMHEITNTYHKHLISIHNHPVVQVSWQKCHSPYQSSTALSVNLTFGDFVWVFMSSLNIWVSNSAILSYIVG